MEHFFGIRPRIKEIQRRIRVLEQRRHELIDWLTDDATLSAPGSQDATTRSVTNELLLITQSIVNETVRLNDLIKATRLQNIQSQQPLLPRFNSATTSSAPRSSGIHPSNTISPVGFTSTSVRPNDSSNIPQGIDFATTDTHQYSNSPGAHSHETGRPTPQVTDRNAHQGAGYPRNLTLCASQTGMRYHPSSSRTYLLPPPPIPPNIYHPPVPPSPFPMRQPQISRIIPLAPAGPPLHNPEPSLQPIHPPLKLGNLTRAPLTSNSPIPQWHPGRRYPLPLGSNTPQQQAAPKTVRRNTVNDTNVSNLTAGLPKVLTYVTGPVYQLQRFNAGCSDFPPKPRQVQLTHAATAFTMTVPERQPSADPQIKREGSLSDEQAVQKQAEISQDYFERTARKLELDENYEDSHDEEASVKDAEGSANTRIMKGNQGSEAESTNFGITGLEHTEGELTKCTTEEVHIEVEDNQAKNGDGDNGNARVDEKCKHTRDTSSPEGKIPQKRRKP